ncbi:hypothetical protein [Amycolatopsis sp. NPDC051372]|uniref:hypothetical protein n=1 Tax=Amycolatopsis sp. NPDC051372 TaxID=3155669 RepID=UPI003430AF0B
MDSVREPYDREAAEQWFRRRGLPSVVRGRPAHLLVRIVPAEVFVVLGLLFTTATSVLDGGSDEEFAHRMDQTWFALLYLVVLLAYVVVPSAGAWLAAPPPTSRGTGSGSSSGFSRWWRCCSSWPRCRTRSGR